MMILIQFDRLFSCTRKYIRISLIIFLLYILLNIFIFVFCPTVVFALSPEEITDYYGNTEYIGKDPYGYFHNPTFNKGESIIATTTDISRVQDFYGAEPPYERDWYSGKKSSSYMYQGNHTYPYNSYSLSDKFRIRLHWYGWKKYTSDYKSFTQFKYTWNPNNSLRKEIMGLFKKG